MPTKTNKKTKHTVNHGHCTLKNSVEVKIGGKQSDHFPVSTGLRQSCVLSPLLFSLYINGLVVELKRKRCGVECGGLLIPGLLFAYDISLFGEDVEGLEQSLMALGGMVFKMGDKNYFRKV